MTQQSELEILGHAHAVLRDAHAGCTDQRQREHLAQVRDGLWGLMRQARSRSQATLVFAFHMHGYLTLGIDGQERIVRDPGLPGLEHAWRIFLLGLTVADTLTASELVGDVKRPDNALRNQLATAATWAEREGQCRELAIAMRCPTLSISDTGHITLVNPPAMRLFC